MAWSNWINVPDVRNVTATAQNVLNGAIFVDSNGDEKTGSMANKGGTTVDASAVSSDDNYTYLNISTRGLYDTNSKVRVPNKDIPTDATLVKLTSSTLCSNASRTVTVTASKHGVDPATLTINNFLIVYASMTAESTSSDANTDAQMSVSYTASTGKLTINKFGNYGYRSNNNTSTPFLKMWVNYNVYLIKNK